MIHAYSKNYLDDARLTLAAAFDYAVNDLDIKLCDFYDVFMNSELGHKFERGYYGVISGMSGIELTNKVLKKKKFKDPTPRYDYTKKSVEYWVGDVLAYYQWYTGLTFKEIASFITIDNIRRMYNPYHEMDITHFCDRLNELYKETYPDTKLKTLRKNIGLTQKELSIYSDIPLRTIQQYEQRQKNINKAQGEYLIKLSKALNCKIEDLLEKI